MHALLDPLFSLDLAIAFSCEKNKSKTKTEQDICHPMVEF